jgi:phosphoribosylaminoimidazolecarboxamide formyltransferase/IMP cyclohydrolase
MDNTTNMEYIKDLKAGATLGQSAKLYKTHNMVDYTSSAELSYVDIKNLTLALSVLSEFYDVCATVLVKNNTLSGVALGATILNSFEKAIDCNPIDAVCGVVALSKPLELELAKLLTPQHLVVAPDIEPKAVEYLETKKIRYVKLNTPLNEFKNYLIEDVEVTPFGTIVQSKNKKELDKDTFKVVSKTKPNVEQIEDGIFAWKITKYLKSVSVVVTKDFKTTGLSQGIQTPAFEYALNNACDNSKDAILASDVPLSIHDLNVAIQGRISLIIQPGVSEDVLKHADKFNISMITTGISNFSL